MNQVVSISLVQPRRQIAVMGDVVEVVDVDVRRMLDSNVTARTERAMARSVGVRVIVLRIVRGAHVRGVVVRHGGYGNPALAVWVAESNHGVVPCSSGGRVSRLINGIVSGWLGGFGNLE